MQSVNNADNFTMGYVCIMLAVDICAYSLISWYLDALMPGDFGVPQPLYFPFTVKTLHGELAALFCLCFRYMLIYKTEMPVDVSDKSSCL